MLILSTEQLVSGLLTDEYDKKEENVLSVEMKGRR